MRITQYDTYAVDENHNIATVKCFGSMEQAVEALESLKDCYWCHNCKNCTNCKSCSYCTNCTDCNECTTCSYLSTCDELWGAHCAVAL